MALRRIHHRAMRGSSERNGLSFPLSQLHPLLHSPRVLGNRFIFLCFPASRSVSRQHDAKQVLECVGGYAEGFGTNSDSCIFFLFLFLFLFRPCFSHPIISVFFTSTVKKLISILFCYIFVSLLWLYFLF
jgi:hypothetical protein